MTNSFRPPAFGRSVRVAQPQIQSLKIEDAAPDERLVLVRCSECRSPIARMVIHSSVEVKCRRCGALTTR
jgi:ribosomal protein S27E